MDVKEVPTGVKIISIIYYISSAIGLITGLLASLYGIIYIAGNPNNFLTSIASLAGLLGPLALVFGIILIPLSIFTFFIAKHLKKGKKWARSFVIAFSILGILGSLSPFNIIGLIISGVIGGYMIFSKKVKEFFNPIN